MEAEADIASGANLLADPTRARVLLELESGRDLPASKLAEVAGVAPSTASSHLAKLARAGLVSVERRGRCRFYRLAGPEVGQAIEAIEVISPPTRNTSLRQTNRARAVHECRMCYDHIGGRVGVELTEHLLRERLLVAADGRFHATHHGVRAFEDIGLDLARIEEERREFALPCLDWSQQRQHLAGALGAALTSTLLELTWIARRGSGRAVCLTEAGRHNMRAAFGFVLEPSPE
jgi:DNA-binding transcriptional ArsR family regulator